MPIMNKLCKLYIIINSEKKIVFCTTDTTTLIFFLRERERERVREKEIFEMKNAVKNQTLTVL